MDFSSQLTNRCLFAVPKKGRLAEKCFKLLEKMDVQYVRKNRLDIAICSTLPIALIFLPAKDIAIYVGKGDVDVGITGQDCVAEANVFVNEILPLGFGKCKLGLQVPKSTYSKPQDLIGKRIATSFPFLTEKFFEKLDPKKTTQVLNVSGSVEVGCALGLADAVVDLVESGDTMRAAGLEMIDTVLATEACLISNPHTKYQDLIMKLKKRMEGVLTAEKYMMIEYNILRSQLEAASKITPGKKSPTVCPLEDVNWVAVKSMILRTESSTVMDALEDIGATAILVTDIHNCRV